MDLLTELKKRADANGDGKINTNDLSDLQAQFNDQGGSLESLKGAADANGDGKIDLQDVQGVLDKLSLPGASDTGAKAHGNILDKLGGFFKHK